MCPLGKFVCGFDTSALKLNMRAQLIDVVIDDVMTMKTEVPSALITLTVFFLTRRDVRKCI